MSKKKKKNIRAEPKNKRNSENGFYLCDLGLTPSGLKKIDEKSMKQKKKSVLAEALNGF